MHTSTLSSSAILASLLAITSARLLGSKQQHKDAIPAADNFPPQLFRQQAPLAGFDPEVAAPTSNPSATYPDHPVADLVPPIPMPTSGADADGAPPSSITLADVLPKTSRINIFASFTRDISTVSDRLDNQSVNTTVLAPLNSVLQSLPRKPWEDPKDYDDLGAKAYEGDEGEDRAHWNLRRFVEGHVVTTNPWKEGEKATTMGGREGWWEEQEGKQVVMPDSVVVDSVIETVGNGQLWIVKGVLDPAR